MLTDATTHAERNFRRALASTAAIAALGVAGTAAAQGTASRAAVPADGGPMWAAVQQQLGGKGTMQPGDVLRFGFPRSDLQVMVDGLKLAPTLALGSWIAFKPLGRGGSGLRNVMVMGDLVLTEDEVSPVMLALQHGGVEQTALHHHVLRESPRVMYMHIMAHGDAVKIAGAIRAALGSSRTPMPQPTGASGAGAATMPSAANDLDTAAIARTIGVGGKSNGGVYQVNVPRRERITDHGTEVPPSMGVATVINFQPTGAGRAAIAGDFVMRGPEVNDVIRALQQGGIAVTALHSHMLTEEPRLFFMHFWANDDAVTLARTLRSALERTNSRMTAR